MPQPRLAAASSAALHLVDDSPHADPPQAPSRTTSELPSSTADGRGRTRSMVALAVPLVLVNAAAVFGQARWAYDHLAESWTVAGLFAAALESIGVYLAAEAHSALMAGDASLRLRLASYAVGGLIGTLNYAHFAGHGFAPNALAITFGALSSISPWLWAIRSRSLNRDRLRTLGLVDPRAVRFSPLRWLLYPRRTFRAFRAAVWAGVVQPAEAVALAEGGTDADDADGIDRVALLEAARLRIAGLTITRDALAVAIRSRGHSVSNARATQLARQLAAELADKEES
jgi:hypothetical protein